MKSNLTDKEKISLLSMLPAGDSVQFEMPNYDDEDSVPRYFPLNTFGLHYKDLDFDGDLDLIYSAQSGWQNLAGSKVYINEENVLLYHSTLRGGLLDLLKTDSSYSSFTIWVPCCDSYTTRIEKHDFSADTIGAFDYSISVIGLRRLRGLPDFSGTKSALVKSPALYASPEDFRGTSPYFRDRSKNIRDSLRAGHYLNLIDLKGSVNVQVLDQKTTKETTWYLVITEPLSGIPRSLYEWSRGSRRRFVGWIKEESFKLN